MAAITTVAAATARWETPATWSSGALPTSADDVTIGNTRYTISAMSGSAGQDAVFTSNGHGLQNNDEVFLGGAGTYPAPFITGRSYWVVQRATNTFKLSNTLGGAAILVVQTGFSTVATVAKKLIFTLDCLPASARVVQSLTLETGVVFQLDTTINTQIQVNRDWIVRAGATVQVDLSALPSIRTNWRLGGSSASTGYGLWFDPSSNWHKLRGKYRNRRATLTSSLTANVTTSFTVDDATGWEVGDRLVLGPTQPRNAVTTIKTSTITIASITPGTGTSATITFTGTGTGGNTTPNLHLATGHVGNFSSNFTLESVNKAAATNRGYCVLSRGLGGNNGAAYTRGTTENLGQVFVENLLFDTMGQAGNRCSLSIPFAGDIPDFSLGGINNNAFFDHTGGLHFTGGGSPCAMPTEGNVAVQLTVNSTGPFTFGNLSTEDVPKKFTSLWALGNNSVYFDTGGQLEVEDFVVAGANWGLFTAAGAASTKVNGLITYCVETIFYGNAANTVVENGDFSRFRTGITSEQAMNRVSGNGTMTFKNCLVPDALRRLSPMTAAYGANPNKTETRIYDINGDSTRQEIYMNRSDWVRPAWERDNVVTKNGLSSLEGRYARSTPMGQKLTFLTVSGVNSRIVGYMRKNADYGSANLPYVEVSGLGTTVRATMSDVNDTWEQFVIDFTQTSGGDGEVTLSMVNTCAGINGSCWFAGIPYVPFVTRVRHYGYRFEESSVVRAISPSVQATENDALAYTGIYVAWGSVSPVTLTATRSIQQVFDYTQAYACQNIASAVPFTAAGVAGNITMFAAADVTLTGCNLEGTGSLDMGGFTLSASLPFAYTYTGGLYSQAAGSSRPAFNGGVLTLPAAGARTITATNTEIRFAAAGTYDLGAGALAGINLVNTSGSPVTVALAAGTSYTNTGPDITVTSPDLTLTITGLQAGSDVVVLAAGTSTVLGSVDSHPGTSWGYTYTAAVSVDIGVFKPGRAPTYVRNYALGTTNASLPVTQPEDRNYV